MIEPKYGLPDTDSNQEFKDAVTSADHTPYADSSEQKSSWLKMCLYIYTAGNQRLSHLALTRQSPESVRFARRSVLLLAIAVTLFATVHFGWFKLIIDPPKFSPPLEPQGNGWVRVVENQDNATGGPWRSDPPPVSFWWNLALGSVLIPVVFSGSYLGCRWILASMEKGIERSLTEEFQGHGRFGAAVRYGTAYWLPAGLAGLLMLLVPLKTITHVLRWNVIPPLKYVYVLAAILAFLSFFLWWFFFLRMAGTVPPRARSRVMMFCAIWTPLKMIIVFGFLGAGFYYGVPELMKIFKLNWVVQPLA